MLFGNKKSMVDGAVVHCCVMFCDVVAQVGGTGLLVVAGLTL